MTIKNITLSLKNKTITINQILFNVLLTIYILFLNSKMFWFINSHTSDFSVLIFIYLIYILLVFIVINLLCFFKKLTYFFACILIITSSFSSYFINTYNVIIDSDMILNALSTDAREISDLMSLSMIFYIVLTAIIPCCAMFFIKIEKSKLFHKILTILMSFSLFGGMAFYSSKTLLPFLRANHSIRYYNSPFYQFYSFYKALKEKFSKPVTIQSISQDAKIITDKFSKTMILVVGETARAKNYSWGGVFKERCKFLY